MPDLNGYQEIKKFYDQIAFPGHYTIDDLEFYQDGITNVYLKTIEDLLGPNKTVLDVGAGTGLITNLFASRFPTSKFTAIDISDSISYGQQFSCAHNILNTIWIQKNFIDYHDIAQFDVVICQGVLHHIPDWDIAISNIKRLVKPGGILLLGVYHPWGKFLQKFWPVEYCNEMLQKDQCNNPFEKTFTQKEISRLMQPLTMVNKYPTCMAYMSESFIASGGLVLYVFQERII